MKPQTTSPPPLEQKIGDRIEVEYQLTGEDYAAYWLFLWDKTIARSSRSLSAGFLRLAIGATLCIIGGLFILSLVLGWKEFWNQDKNLRPMLSALVVFFILFVVLLLGVGPKSFSRRFVRRARIRHFRLQTKGIQPTRKRVILSPTEVIETCLDLRGKLEWVIDWKVFDSIELGEHHAFFFTQSSQALIVPQRAFPDQKAFLDFVETAWTYHRRAKENLPAMELPHSSTAQTKRAEERITTRPDDGIHD